LSSEESKFKLYRFEYLLLGDRVVDWIWLTDEDEAKQYMTGDSGISGVIYRQATNEEAELYDEAFNDGHGLGIAESRMESHNGVMHRLDSFKATDEEFKLDTTKIFTCGECGESELEFETKAVTTGGYYVAKEKDGVLWHICFDCGYDCRHDWTHFSRTLCACGSMHDYCDTCDEALDCEFNEKNNWDSPYKRKKK
jgi:hypothetical protein